MMADDMENQDRHNGAEAEVPPQAASSTAGADAEALAAAIAERDEFKDRLLRTLAEMENLRRRTEREVADARTYAVTNFARDMLNAADNIHRALESVPADARASAEGAFKALVEGIELTERDLAKTLERHGVKVVDPQGQRFDPNRHQAMFEVPNTEVPNGTVVQVVQTGYVIGERTLRPALVGVSKGGPKPEASKDKPADPA
ncbi:MULTISPECIES: nucleotide exchange factor GrpE [Methylorubrum]|uniref:Protein GrpE n=2 Tax=Methylorubrum TaxID=2282523 RepID=A0A514KI57_9HYPH|nr:MULTISPECIES: nucleotide exchange factor GrpE [Methylorubrum]KAB7787723.1 Heat shock protein GrpE [Methylorubrum populi]MBA8915199.1 molecular chaperone GrpE [Methylorubrum thiocyanatum]QDI79290.1 nucleotide exchange factor GrpE [Methylorubrum populi]GJE81950.1 Protein GrpE [Methylorubrum thiocyanatum]